MLKVLISGDHLTENTYFVAKWALNYLPHKYFDYPHQT